MPTTLRQDCRWVVRRGRQDRRGQCPSHLRRFVGHTFQGLRGCPFETRDHSATAVRLYERQKCFGYYACVDVMDLLHSGRFDVLCLASSDSGLTRFAARIREQASMFWLRGAEDSRELPAGLPSVYLHRESCFRRGQGQSPAAAQPLQPASAAVPLKKGACTGGSRRRMDQPRHSWQATAEPGAGLRSAYLRISKTYRLVRKTNQFEIHQAEGGPVSIRPKQKRQN